MKPEQVVRAYLDAMERRDLAAAKETLSQVTGVRVPVAAMWIAFIDSKS